MEIPIIDTFPAARVFLAVLLHFIWQAVVVFAFVTVVRSLIHPVHCQVRYLLSVLGLVALLFFPLLTLGYYTVNPDAILALQDQVSQVDGATVASPEATNLVGQLDVVFQAVFSWFDNHRTIWLGAWLVGFLVLVLRLSLSLGHCIRLRRSLQPLPPAMQIVADQLKTKLGLTQLVMIGASKEITQAVATGVIRPVVLVPAAWVTQLPVSAVEAVLAHELSHVKRWDLWVNFFQRFIETVFFFHPLVWWLSRRISNEREICCDRLAVRITGQPLRYVETLAHVAGTKHMEEFEFQFSTAFSGGKNMNLLRRAKLILEPASLDGQAPLRTLIFLAFAGLLISYGSYAYSASAIPATIQDQGHKRGGGADIKFEFVHDQEHDQDHGDHSDNRRWRERVKERETFDFYFDDRHNPRESSTKQELQKHLAELLHRNQGGSVSHQEIVQQLRELADQLESRTNRVDRDARHDIEISWDDDHQRSGVDPRRVRDRPVIQNEFNRSRESSAFFRKRRPDQAKASESGERENDQSHSPERNRWIGELTSVDQELGQVLHELRNEVKQLRQEVNRLKSNRDAPSRGVVRDDFQWKHDSREHSGADRHFEYSEADVDRHGRFEFKMRQRNEREPGDADVDENDQPRYWFWATKDRSTEDHETEDRWIEEEHDGESSDDEPDEIEVEEESARRRDK